MSEQEPLLPTLPRLVPSPGKRARIRSEAQPLPQGQLQSYAPQIDSQPPYIDISQDEVSSRQDQLHDYSARLRHLTRPLLASPTQMLNTLLPPSNRTRTMSPLDPPQHRSNHEQVHPTAASEPPNILHPQLHQTLAVNGRSHGAKVDSSSLPVRSVRLDATSSLLQNSKTESGDTSHDKPHMNTNTTALLPQRPQQNSHHEADKDSVQFSERIPAESNPVENADIIPDHILHDSPIHIDYTLIHQADYLLNTMTSRGKYRVQMHLPPSQNSIAPHPVMQLPIYLYALFLVASKLKEYQEDCLNTRNGGMPIERSIQEIHRLGLMKRDMLTMTRNLLSQGGWDLLRQDELWPGRDSGGTDTEIMRLCFLEKWEEGPGVRGICAAELMLPPFWTEEDPCPLLSTPAVNAFIYQSWSSSTLLDATSNSPGVRAFLERRISPARIHVYHFLSLLSFLLITIILAVSPKGWISPNSDRDETTERQPSVWDVLWGVWAAGQILSLVQLKSSALKRCLHVPILLALLLAPFAPDLSYTFLTLSIPTTTLMFFLPEPASIPLLFPGSSLFPAVSRFLHRFGLFFRAGLVFLPLLMLLIVAFSWSMNGDIFRGFFSLPAGPIRAFDLSENAGTTSPYLARESLAVTFVLSVLICLMLAIAECSNDPNQEAIEEHTMSDIEYESVSFTHWEEKYGPRSARRAKGELLSSLMEMTGEQVHLLVSERKLEIEEARIASLGGDNGNGTAYTNGNSVISGGGNGYGSTETTSQLTPGNTSSRPHSASELDSSPQTLYSSSETRMEQYEIEGPMYEERKIPPVFPPLNLIFTPLDIILIGVKIRRWVQPQSPHRGARVNRVRYWVSLSIMGPFCAIFALIEKIVRPN